MPIPFGLNRVLQSTVPSHILNIHSSRHPPEDLPLQGLGGLLEPAEAAAVLAEGLLDLAEAQAAGLGHEEPADEGGDEGAGAEEEVGAVAGLGEQGGGDEGDEEVGDPVAAVGDARGGGARPLGLDLGRVDLDADGPGDAVQDGEHVDADDDDPATGTASRAHGVPGVQAAHEEHGGRHAEAPEDGLRAAAPPVRADGRRDRHGEYDDRRHAGGEEGGLGGRQAGLLEEEGCVLD